MKFLSNLRKRTEIVGFLLGFTVGTYMLFLPARYFVVWHALPKSPEPAIKIIESNHMGDVTINTASNKKFACNIYNKKECWTKLDNNYEPLDLGATLCLMENCSTKHVVQMTKASNAPHDIAKITTTYSLHDNGNIYVKQSGILYLFGYIVAVFIGGFFAFIGKLLF